MTVQDRSKEAPTPKTSFDGTPTCDRHTAVPVPALAQRRAGKNAKRRILVEHGQQIDSCFFGMLTDGFQLVQVTAVQCGRLSCFHTLLSRSLALVDFRFPNNLASETISRAATSADARPSQASSQHRPIRMRAGWTRHPGPGVVIPKRSRLLALPAQQSISIRIDSIQFVCELIRIYSFCKKNWPFASLVVMLLFLLIQCIVSAKNKLSLFAVFNTLEHRQKTITQCIL